MHDIDFLTTTRKYTALYLALGAVKIDIGFGLMGTLFESQF